ncbi:MAG: murein biosynthesis integral membrane protein MurJ, partial [Planctomycetota bacterium]
MAKLIQQTERGPVVHELLFGSTSIGRGWLNDVVIADPGERRHHADVAALAGGGYAVRDLGSRAGVRVNGEPVEGQRRLADGDVIQVGGVEFKVDLAEPEASGEGEAAAAAPKKRKGLLGGVVKLTLGTLLSRGFGLAREMVGMAYFGASGAFDAYVAATTLPNLFRDVLGEHAAEGAFMPAHKTLRVRGRQGEARRLFTSVLWFVLLTGLWLVLLCGVFAPHLTAVVVPGFVKRHPELWGKTISLAQLMMPYLVIIALASVFGGLLLGDRRFVRYAVAPAGSSACVILAVVVLSGELGVWSLAVGLLAGGTVQMLICAMPYLRRWREMVTGERPRIDPSQPALRKVARAVVPIGMAGLLNKLIWIVDRALASWFCFPGAISALYAAHRLLQLPHGVVGLAVGRAAFPSLVEQASSREEAGFSRAVAGALRLNVFLTLPAMVGLVVLSRPIVRLMYERGAFTAEHTGWVTLAVVCYGVGLV